MIGKGSAGNDCAPGHTNVEEAVGSLKRAASSSYSGRGDGCRPAHPRVQPKHKVDSYMLSARLSQAAKADMIIVMTPTQLAVE